MMRLLLILLCSVSAFGQMTRADRFSVNAYQFAGVMHGTATVSGNVTSNGVGLVTVNTAATHGLVAGDRAVIASCATGGLNGDWTIASAPTGSSFTYVAAGVNDANSASCVLTSYKVIATRTFYVSGVVIINNSTSDKTVNIRDRGTACASGPCRVVPANLTVYASSQYPIWLPYIAATSGLQISASDGTSIEYRIVGTY